MDLPLHTKLVHLPIALAVLLPLLSSGIRLACWRRQAWLPMRSWILVVTAQSLLVASGWFAMQSGEQDEERVERVVPEAAIEAHEEAAEVFVWSAAGLLVVSLLPLVLGGRTAARGAGVATVVGSLVVLWLGYRVGEAGGELVYRHGAASVWTDAAGNADGTGTGVAPGLEQGGRTGARVRRGDGDDEDERHR